ncbi:MAG TPA: phosphoribosylglycinamide formyltransferase [Gemmatimonadaceae bacterium]|nr:phosphoribosylglycinamide formyltransferase [Gemmatimonadaceae bacterium]
MTARLAVLASGGGSNLQALLDYLDALGERRAGEVVLVASDRARAGALARARQRAIATALVRGPSAPDGQDLLDVLHSARADYVVLAGYLRLVPAAVVREYAGRIVNVHPALLPAFGGPGMFGHHVHQAVIASGARESGPTVHFVDEHFDHGAIIAQWAIPVRPDETAETLAVRVLQVEHVLYPRVVQALVAGRIRAGQPPVTGRTDASGPAPEAAPTLIREIEHALRA